MPLLHEPKGCDLLLAFSATVCALPPARQLKLGACPLPRLARVSV